MSLTDTQKTQTEISLSCCGFKVVEERAGMCTASSVQACETPLLDTISSGSMYIYGTILISAAVQFVSFLLACYLAGKYATRQRKEREERELEKLSLKRRISDSIPMRPLVMTPDATKEKYIPSWYRGPKVLTDGNSNRHSTSL